MIPAALRLAFPLVTRRYVPLLAGSAAALTFCWTVPLAVWIEAYRDEMQRRVFFKTTRRKCDPKFEREADWRAFLATASENDAWEAILIVFDLGRSLQARRCGKTHLSRLYEIGCQDYERRFGKPWVPF